MQRDLSCIGLNLQTVILIGLVFSFVFAVEKTRADIFQITPSIRVRGEYNDNIFVSPTNELDDFILFLIPGLDISERSERLAFDLNGRLENRTYRENDFLDQTDQFYNGNINYRIIPRLGVSANAGYIRDSRPDRDLTDTGFVLFDDVRRTWRVGAGLNIASSATTSNILSYEYRDTEYEIREFNDSIIQTLNFSHTWNMQRFFNAVVGRLNLGYANAEFSTSEVDSFSGTLGASWSVGELWDINFNAGLRYTRTEFLELQLVPPGILVSSEEATYRLSGVGDVSVIYSGLYTSGSIVFFNDVREAEGRGGTALRTGLQGSLRRRFTEGLSGRIFASLIRNETVEGLEALSPVDQLTFSFLASLAYTIRRDLSVSLNYRHGIVDNFNIDTEAYQNRVFAQINWRYPIFEQR